MKSSEELPSLYAINLKKSNLYDIWKNRDNKRIQWTFTSNVYIFYSQFLKIVCSKIAHHANLFQIQSPQLQFDLYLGHVFEYLELLHDVLFSNFAFRSQRKTRDSFSLWLIWTEQWYVKPTIFLTEMQMHFFSKLNSWMRLTKKDNCNS